MALAPTNALLSDDDQLLISATREFAQHELLPWDRQADRTEASITDMLSPMADMGLLNLVLPASLNGLDCQYRVYASIIHELAAFSPAAAVTVAVHNMAGKIAGKFISDRSRLSQLSSFGTAEHLAAFALSEANAGSDGKAIATRAQPVAGGYVVDGEKMWITNGLNARWFLTLVRIAGLPRDESFCALLIDGRSPGITRTKIIGKMGIRGSETAVVHFHNVFVPDSDVVGEPGKGLRVFLFTLNEGRVGIAAQSTGVAEACLSQMTAYARQRVQFDEPIGKFQAVASMVADSKVELEAAKALTWRAACAVDEGQVDRTASSQAKLYASEAANRIAYRAVQVHGGAGYVQESRVEQLYRDARVTTIYEGTSEVQRIIIAEELKKRASRES